MEREAGNCMSFWRSTLYVFVAIVVGSAASALVERSFDSPWPRLTMIVVSLTLFQLLQKQWQLSQLKGSPLERE